MVAVILVFLFWGKVREKEKQEGRILRKTPVPLGWWWYGGLPSGRYRAARAGQGRAEAG